MAIVCPECPQDACCHFTPKSPDPYLKTQGDMSPAKFGHLNHLVDEICCISDSIETLQEEVAALTGVGFSSFYGLTTGTGNAGPNDYAATIAVKTIAGTGRVPFPRNGPTSGVATNGSTVFTIPTAGTYEVTFVVNVDEPAQLQLEVNGADLPETLVSRATGTNQIIGTSIITVPAGALLAVINPVGNATALTVTPSDGSLTHAIAQTLTIKKLA